MTALAWDSHDGVRIMVGFRSTAGAAGCALLAMSVVACSNSSGGTSSTSSGAGGSGGSLKGAPIKIAIINDTVAPQLGGGAPENVAAVKAAVSGVNAAGGVNGRPLEVTACDTKGDPNQVQACASQVVADKDVVATVGNQTNVASPVKILNAGGVADFGEFAISADDFSLPNSFPVMGLPLGAIECASDYAGDLAGKGGKVGYVYISNPGVSALNPVVDSIVAKTGASVKSHTSFSATASDFSPTVASATNGTQVVQMSGGQQNLVAYLRAAQSAHATTKTVAGIDYDSTSLAKSKGVLNGLYQCLQWKPLSVKTQGSTMFQAEAKSSGLSFSLNETAINAWLSVHILTTIMKTMTGTIDRATVLAKIPTMSNLSTYGFSTPVSFNKKYTGFGGKFPQLMNRVEYRAKVVNGQSVLVSQTPYQG